MADYKKTLADQPSLSLARPHPPEEDRQSSLAKNLIPIQATMHPAKAEVFILLLPLLAHGNTSPDPGNETIDAAPAPTLLALHYLHGNITITRRNLTVNNHSTGSVEDAVAIYGHKAAVFKFKGGGGGGKSTCAIVCVDEAADSVSGSSSGAEGVMDMFKNVIMLRWVGLGMAVLVPELMRI